MNETDVLNQEQTDVSTEQVEDMHDVGETDAFDWLEDGEVDKPTTTTETKPEEIPIEEKVEVKEEKVETDVPQDSKDEQVQSPFMTIKYNKESKDLTQEEAITLAQKGMNYDHILEQYNAVKDNEESIKELRRVAQANNMSVGDLVKGLTDLQSKLELDKEIEALREQYPNSDDALLTELAQSHLSTKANIVSKQKEEAAAKIKQEISEDIDRLKAIRPNIDPSKLDPEVYSMVKNKGFRLTEAYLTWESTKRDEIDKQKEESLKAERLNMENKKKSLGSTSSVGDATVDDEFITTLFS